jgi:hypothetical protein
MDCLRMNGRPGAGFGILAVLLLGFCGCGTAKYPVTGKIVFKDGTPLPGGLIVFSPVDPANHTGARGYIDADGTFTMSTDSEGDGSLAGRYKALIRGPTQGHGEDDPLSKVPMIDIKYYSFEKSGLEFDVKPGPNDFTITVDRNTKTKGR